MNEKDQDQDHHHNTDDKIEKQQRGGANNSSANELLVLSNANTPTDSTSSPEELMQQQKIYSKGFLDALRVIQTANNFEFRPATSPIIPPLGTPGAGGTAITPATANDMHQIMLSLLGTPVTTSNNTNTNTSATNATTTSTSAPPLPTTPTLLSSPTLSLSDSDVLKLYASTVLPGPPLASLHLPPSTNNTTNNTNNEHHGTNEHMPPFNNSLISAAVAAAAASTSRPDKLNLPPPQMMDNNMGNSSDDSDSGMGYMNSRSTSRNMHGREMSMDDQERKKLDRKRARNRQAATKCRQKKMDRIRELEEQVTSEKARAARLNNELNQLQSVLSAYREAVSNHQTRGCRAS